MYKSLEPQPYSFLSNSAHPSLQRIFADLVVSIFLAYSAPRFIFLRALIPPYFLVEMISKLFLIQAFVALLIIALTSPVNAAAIAPGLARDLRRDSVPASARFIEEPKIKKVKVPCAGITDPVKLDSCKLKHTGPGKHHKV
ncbi:hypothetical protein BGY98DRAFT_18426 [Russula aff. rugulosa BPL654]|nr:hypothetical protein BGY98DRAFT_18426 [Russula aff. rugulosa BPL654]